MTKETLLSYEWFIDNEYLDQYLELVNTADQTVKEFEKHHIIPACWYKLRFAKTKLDYRTIANGDIKEELVKLSIPDHIKAHELLTNCTTGKFNELLVGAVNYMTKVVRRPKVKKQKIKRKKKPVEETAAYRYKQRQAKNKIAAAIWHQHPEKTWEDCKAEAAIIYENDISK